MLNDNLRIAYRLAVPALLAGALAACGGGGGGVPSSQPAPAQTQTQTQVQAPTTAPAAASEPVPATTPAEPVAAIDGPAVDECAAAKAEWIWCDDFEHDRSASYFEATMPRENGVGREGSNAAVGRYLLGTSEGGNLKLAFGRTPSAQLRPADDGTKDYREVYWRVYIKQPKNWQGGGADKMSRATVFSGSSWQQAMIAHVWSSRSDNDAYLKFDPASGVNSAGSVKTKKYNDFGNLTWMGVTRGKTPLFADEHKGEWHCVEARVRLNDAGKTNGVFQLWVNGELDVERTNLNWVGTYKSYGINAVFLENYWNAGTPVEQERYMDNFVVSTARIGCGN